VDLDLVLGGGLQARVLTVDDAGLLAEATSGETARSLWAGRPAGPYLLDDAQTALSQRDPAAHGQFSMGIFRAGSLAGAIGLMPDGPASVELAYWTRPEQRGRGIASRALDAVTEWAHEALGASRVWLEINPRNKPSLRLAERAGYRFEKRLPRHCRDWSCEDAAHDSWHDCLIWVHHGE
jgi:RimJ/RimL family protein N-acetyltransferase